MKKNQTFSILFYIKRTKKRTNGEVPVYCKVTISGKSSEWSLYKSIKENKKFEICRLSDIIKIDKNEFAFREIELTNITNPVTVKKQKKCKIAQYFLLSNRMHHFPIHPIILGPNRRIKSEKWSFY